METVNELGNLSKEESTPLRNQESAQLNVTARVMRAFSLACALFTAGCSITEPNYGDPQFNVLDELNCSNDAQKLRAEWEIKQQEALDRLCDPNWTKSIGIEMCNLDQMSFEELNELLSVLATKLAEIDYKRDAAAREEKSQLTKERSKIDGVIGALKNYRGNRKSKEMTGDSKVAQK